MACQVAAAAVVGAAWLVCCMRSRRGNRSHRCGFMGGRAARVLYNDTGHLLKPVRTAAEAEEAAAYEHLSASPLRSYVPHFYGMLRQDGARFADLANVLQDYRMPYYAVEFSYSAVGGGKGTIVAAAGSAVVRLVSARLVSARVTRCTASAALSDGDAGAAESFSARIAEIEGVAWDGYTATLSHCCIMLTREVTARAEDAALDVHILRPALKEAPPGVGDPEFARALSALGAYVRKPRGRG
eukprot:TRINITY_DN21877_c1_g1_i1.p1 TRINITY_DN21877_c1_g1~~TRINITY_DN21877_c1_g1_i1.p1  ORF type:complete len:270 (+),score=65.83 TRINITY_DN21877_c1_g1_i1:85-810(+)